MFMLKQKSLVRLNVNGLTREALIRPGDILLDTLRNELGADGRQARLPQWRLRRVHGARRRAAG